MTSRAIAEARTILMETGKTKAEMDALVEPADMTDDESR